MRIAVLGTGSVGRAVAGRLGELGHDVVVGTRDPATTLARTEPDGAGTPAYPTWAAHHPEIRLVTLADAGAHAELIVNATNGNASITALQGTGLGERTGTIVVDVANPLAFGDDGVGLTVAITDSLGEQIQRAFPQARVVKTLNTMNAAVMVRPGLVPGDHVVFVAGDDPDAKTVVTELLGAIGWPGPRILDLGGIRAARGTEAYLLTWLTVAQTIGTFEFNIAVARG